MEHVISESCNIETILLKNYRKLSMKWSFSYNSLVTLHGKKTRSHNITVLYPYLCYIEACYKGTTLYN